MRVLLISDLFPPVTGGLEVHVDALATELTRRGDDVAVATLTSRPRPTDSNVRTFTISSATRLLPHEDAQRPFQPPVAEPVSRLGLRQSLRTFRPDVIHGHSLLTLSLPPKLATPILYTAHDYGLVCQLRTLMHFPQFSCSGPTLRKCIECGTHTYGRAKSTLLAAGTVVGRRRFPAQRVVAVSDAVQSALLPHLDVPVDVIPNFVAAGAPAEPLPDHLPPAFVLFAGDARAYKGVPELFEVWRRQQPRLPLVLASPRPTSEPTPEGVITLRLSRGQMTSAWRRATLAVVPSRWADPCPTVVLEAMRNGVPVVGTRTGGIQELVRDGIDGVLVTPGNATELGAAIDDLLTNDAVRDQLGAAARDRASAFTVEAVAYRLRSLYLSMTAENSAAP